MLFPIDMKKFATIAAALIVCAGAYAQDDAQKAAAEAAAALVGAPKEEAAPVKPKYWANSVVFDLGLNQTSLTNWAAGGFKTVTFSAGIDGKANYTKDLLSWNNRLQLQYGFIWSEDKANVLQKNNDLMYLESKFAYKTGKESKWNYTASFDFRSQFSDTFGAYEEKEDGKWTAINLKSGLFSPAYTNVALGMEWKPSDWFNINIAPLTGGFTIVTNPDLRKQYGMALIDADNPESAYRSALFQFGAQIKTNAKFAINDVFNFETQLVVFTNYLHKPLTENRVNWDNKITWQVAKFFKIGFNTWLIYDPIVEIDGVKSKVQFKDFLAFNFTYTFGKK